MKNLSEQNGGISVTIAFNVELIVFPNYKVFKDELIQGSPILCLRTPNVRVFWVFQLLLEKLLKPTVKHKQH